jgi:hypothetical protein
MKRTCGVFLSLLLLATSIHAAILCDGVDDDGFDGPTSDALTASAATITLWAKPTGSSPSVGSASLGQGLAGEYEGNVGLFRATVAGQDLFWAVNNDGASAEVGGTYTVDTWTHLALVHGAGILELYVNGVSAGSTASGDTSNIAFDMTLCKTNIVSGLTFNGLLEDVRVFPTALSATDILALASSRLRYGHLHNGTMYWVLDDCADGTSADGYAFLQRSGTLTGNTMLMAAEANTTGVTCRASELLSSPWGAN